jgi:hypothetical protein
MISKLFFGLTLLALTGCVLEESISSDDPSDTDSIATPHHLRQVVFADSGRDSLGVPYSPDPYTIDTITFRGDTLVLTVSWSGGCKTHTFKLFSGYYLYLSMPPQIDLFPYHDGNGDDCEALLHDTLFFDLKPIGAWTKATVYLRIYRYGASAPIIPLLRYDPVGYEPFSMGSLKAKLPE